jgi:hypothetical protein
MVEPALLVKHVLEHFGTKAANPRRVIVTAGGTREYLDPVRCLTNSSTGATAQTIAAHLLARGHHVDYFHGEGASVPESQSGLRLYPFVSARDLEHRLLQFLKANPVDAVIHAAAVSDYTISKTSPVKLDSRAPQTLPLLPAPKIVDQIRAASQNPKVRLIAFKLTHEATREERLLRSRELLEHSGADLVISNAIFADGSAAVLLGKQTTGQPSLVDFSSLVVPEWRDEIRFRTDGGRLRNVLSKEIPSRAAEAAEKILEPLFKRHGLTRKDISHWALHPGGEKVISALQKKLDLSSDALRPTRETLQRYGNLSSPAVLFVLEKILTEKKVNAGEWGVLLSFGAGFSAHAALLRF